MQMHRLVLFALMAAIGLSGLMGIYAVFATPNSTGDLEWLIGVTFALMAGMFAVSPMLLRAPYRAAGLLAVMLLLTIWLLIWAAACTTVSLPGAWQLQNRLNESALLAFIMGIPAVIAAAFRTHRWARIASWFCLIVVSYVTVVFSVAIWFFNSSSAQPRLNEKVGELAFVICLFALPMTLLLINAGCGDRRYFRWPALAVASFGLAMAIGRCWNSSWRPSSVEHADWLVLVITSTLAYVNLLLMSTRKGWVRWLKWAAIFATLFTGALGAVFQIQLTEYEGDNPSLHRWILVSLILVATATIGLIVTRVAPATPSPEQDRNTVSGIAPV